MPTSAKPASKAASKASAKTPAKSPAPALSTIRCKDTQAFTQWLAKHHGSSAGVRLQIAKKDSGIASITHAEALEAALCQGWIDGQRNAMDAQYFLQKFTPRRARSTWSKVNCAKALALIESGAMQPAGLAEVERARADGRWDAAYDAQSKMTVPEDLAALLAKSIKAKAFFESLDSRNRFAILFRLQAAKKSETRERRLVKFADMLKRGEKIHP
ncbi:YdeI/OmpD-associated family protein [Polaromonas aquatica]|uniref:YdeI/OmpD-associated family protein n=1 Tax=Polaromonas aquatica TaxID=332657 RepID=UPI003D64E9E9